MLIYHEVTQNHTQIVHTFPSILTAHGGEKALNIAPSYTQDKIAMQGSVQSDGEASEDHKQASNSQVQKNVVEGRAELLVLHGDVESQEVNRERSDHQEQHIGG